MPVLTRSILCINLICAHSLKYLKNVRANLGEQISKNNTKLLTMNFHETQLDLDFPQQSKVEMKESEHEVGVYRES